MTGLPTSLQERAAAAFDELGRVVLPEHSMESVLERGAELARDVVPGAEEVSVTLLTGERARTVVATGALALDLDERQYAVSRGPCLDGTRAGERVLIEDMATETRWRDHVEQALERGGRSSLTVPLPLQQTVTAALNICATRPHVFDADSQELPSRLASYAAVALANTHLHDSARQLTAQLETALASRAVIEQAKGVLMGLRRCSAPEAFDVLVDLSQRSDRRLRDVAQALVDSTGDSTDAITGSMTAGDA